MFKIGLCVVLCTLNLFKQFPVSQSQGLQILELLFRNQAVTQCASVYIHGSEELEEFAKLRENRDGFSRAYQQNSIFFSLCIKYVVLTSSYISKTKIAREIFQYAEASSEVLLPAKIGYVKSFRAKYIEKVVYDVFERSFYLSAHCLFVIVDNGDVFQWGKYATRLHVHEHPANMVLAKFRMQNSHGRKTVVLYVHYMCYDYCPQQWTQFANNLLPPISLHKKYVYKANSRSIRYSFWPRGPIDYSNLFALCSKAVPLRCNGDCSAYVMIVLAISDIHNLTVKVFNQRSEAQEKAFFDGSDPYIVSPEFLESEITLEVIYILIYDRDTYQKLYYCSETNLLSVDESKLFYWIAPFTIPLWLYCFTLLATPVCATFCRSKSVSESVAVLIGVVGMVLKQYTYVVGKKLLVFTSFFALIVCSFYESQITSLAIVQLPPPVIQSLQELVSKRYKILLFEELPLDYFESEFKSGIC
ncbi:unnamed protein product [Orchesella dallaii]|uniref:Uncharacterized protein n=1 Tax=Orchesella dallaii TaxID=48710 RepID=A0ABP1RPN7_9HEXA